SEAEKRDIQVYLGLYISNLTWNDGDYKGEIAQNKLLNVEFQKIRKRSLLNSAFFLLSLQNEFK
ncbi:MAG: hypothetical protein J6Q19_07415, partial [Bacteroidaceae bacterium]|nr:hypothetical protein [Bacteroidaceae bacterium]